MRILVGRILRGILRRVALEVRSSVRHSESTDRDALRDPVVVAMLLRLHAHPDVESITMDPNWWGGFTIVVGIDADEVEYHGADVVEALAIAISDVYDLDS